MSNLDMLDNFIGDAVVVEIPDGNGVMHKIKLYSQPMFFLPKMLRLEGLSKRLIAAQDPASPQFGNMTEADKELQAQLMLDVSADGLAYSLAKDDGLLTKEVEEAGPEKVKEVIAPFSRKIQSNFPMSSFEPICAAIMKVNKVKDEGGAKKDFQGPGK